MAIEEKEQKETILDELIEKVEKDPIPTNIFTTEDTDPLVLLGKLNEVIAHLKALRLLIGESDSKATEALTKAIESLTIAQEAITTATTLGNEAKADAQSALEQANSAHDTAGEALMEATDALTKAEQAITSATTLGNEAKADAQQAITTATTLGNEAKALAQQAITTANEALSQVVQGLGTKVYDNHGNILAKAKFTGHNGVNVDMSETDPEAFDIRLDNAITTAIEDNHTQGQTNKANIEALTTRVTTDESNISGLTSRVTANEGDIVELTNMLSATEELAQKNTEDIANTINPKLESLENDKVDKTALGDFTFNSQTGEGTIKHRGYNLTMGRGYLSYTGESYIFLDINGNVNPFRAQINLKDIALIEEKGTNYIRFTNGLQICWGRTNATKNTTITYPKPFKDANSYSCSGCSNGWSGSYGNYGMSNLTATDFYYNADKNYVWLWVAIGYWK